MDQNQDPWESETIQQEVTENTSNIQEKKTSKLAIVSLILLIFPPAGLILSIISLHFINSNDQLKGKTLALKALIINISLLVIITGLIIWFFVIKEYSFINPIDPGYNILSKSSNQLRSYLLAGRN